MSDGIKSWEVKGITYHHSLGHSSASMRLKLESVVE